MERIEETTFCDEREKFYVEAYNEKFAKCSTEYPQKMVDWLERKKLLKVARELDWRWHNGSIFKGWKEGIVIPHRKLWTGENIDYVRIREWNGEGFDKPKGSFKMTIEPYFSTFRPNSVQFLVEGESDSASIYAHGGSAVGIPGATSKKAINTVLATFNDLPFVKSVIVCGDNDDAGEEMNKLVLEAGKKIAPRLTIRPFKHRLTEKGMDINDEHTNGLLRLPVQFTANYGGNYDRQPWADKDFVEAIEKIEKAEDDGAEWDKVGNIYILRDKDGEEVDC
jgi:5S rRNA maturation endonuclease (ribonuclease M5)